MRFQGQPQRLLPYCLTGITLEEVATALNFIKRGESDYLGSDAVFYLASLFGIDEYKAMLGYQYLEDELSYAKEDRDIRDVEEFIFIE